MTKLSARQILVLTYIASHPGTVQTAAGIWNTVSALIDRGLITRDLYLTEHGAAALNALHGVEG